ncbi:hypothetical protein HAX54_013690, partial [Datura stramonium]|nr:hypothetical protein [Datura stramonium]
TNKIIERYQKNDKNSRHDNIVLEQTTTTEHLKEEVISMTRKLELLENSKRRLLGEDLDSCSTDELEQVEQQLDRSLKNIRARKEKVLAKRKLRNKIEVQPLPLFIDRQEDENPQRQRMEAETQLFIGLPQR